MSALYDDHADGLALTKRHFMSSLIFPSLVVLSILAIQVYQYYTDFDPGLYGIMSRRFWGLRGIVTGPLVHGSWKHVLSNSVPLFVLTFICLYFYRKVALQAFWLIYFSTGVAVWFFARPVSHIGASGVVYGLVSFVFWNGVFRRSLRSIILASIVIILYSGMFMGVLPDQEGISWESHLIGSLMGIFAAYVFKSELEDEEVAEQKEQDPFAADRHEEKEYYLPRDAFEKTKAQRQAEAEEEARRQAEELARQQQNPFEPPFWTSTFS